jgi:hypothetical protein
MVPEVHFALHCLLLFAQAMTQPAEMRWVLVSCTDALGYEHTHSTSMPCCHLSTLPASPSPLYLPDLLLWLQHCIIIINTLPGRHTDETSRVCHVLFCASLKTNTDCSQAKSPTTQTQPIIGQQLDCGPRSDQQCVSRCQ